MASSKTKTLLIYKYLFEYSDENHPLSTTDLINMLKKDGITCERKSIYADIKTLNSVGFDIIPSVSTKRGFFLASRTFELAQVRLLIDAVTSAGFITPNKTRDLVSKLESLISKNDANQLVSQVYVDSNTKCDNEEIYYIIDALHDAIIHQHKVKFLYKRRNIDKENRKSYTEKTFRVSPYALIWKDDHYYLVCNNEKYDNLMNLRLDRIRKIEQLDSPSRDISEVSEYEDFIDVSDYTSKMFNMFSGETGEVTLRCHLDLREEIMDRFGSKIPLVAVDTDHFETTINAAVSHGLVAWIMNFGDKIKVVKPDSLAQEVKKQALTIAQLYE
ncbi:MAG: WYL domain-containing protein [Ruminococcaceae bacterium]|nr:WYL domain-containing protein [Oscillospiraceae bacterium]